MKASLFDAMIVGWSPKISWTKADLKKVDAVLLAICKANAGAIVLDVEIDTSTRNAFAIQRLEDALNRWVAPYAKGLREKFLSLQYSTPSKDQVKYLMPELVSTEWKECININTNDADLLCTLPGLDRKTALAIINYSQKNGPFSGVDQLASLIDAKSFETIETMIFCGAVEKFPPVMAEISNFMSQPTFQNYVASIVGAKDSLIWSSGKKEDPKVHILSELKNALADVAANKFGRTKNLRYTRASNVLSEQKMRDKVNTITARTTQVIDCGALLYDGQYLSLVSRLFKYAKKSIYVMMFFMKYEEGNKYVANTLVEGLAKARRRNLDIRVILDKDAEDEVTKSRLINEPAFQMLNKNNVQVLYDSLDRMTHSKLIIVDDQHIVLGSHNWTAGSLWSYNDTSVYMDSTELAGMYKNIFDTSWESYLKLVPAKQ